MTWNDLQLRQSRVSAGTRLNGIYEIECQIGAGGMGEVYKGHAIQTGDPVAIKMMLGELVEDEAALALFRKEASALHYLQHDAIVRYYVFTVEPVLQRPYLAMEFVDGRSLSDILDERPLPFEAVRSLMQRVAAGLQAAHERGITHRDVSPDNIIVPQGDVTRAKLIDFGIARSTHLGHGTVIGSGFAGKHNYVSPEQLGLFDGDVTAKSDIYSLGLVLYQAVTGRALDMGGSQVDIVEKRRKVPDLGAIDMRFRPLLERMLQPDPSRRPQSMSEVASWPLGSPALTSSAGRHTTPGARTDDAAARPRARPIWQYGVAAMVVLLVGGGGTGGYYYHMTQKSVPAQRPAPPSFELSVAPMTPRDPPGGSKGAAPTGPTARPEFASRLAPPAPEKDTLGLPALLSPSEEPAARPRPSAPTGAKGTEKVRQYVEQYDGGDCFFVTPMAIGDASAALEGFGASIRPFEALDTAFQREQGFEASIGVRQVTQAQCPAITFLTRLRGERGRAPRLNIESVRLRNGESLSGTVEGLGSRNVELLLVSDGGTVQNVSNLLKPGTDANSFNIGMRREGLSGSQPQLLIAVATSKPLESLRPSGAVPADRFFPAVVAEADKARQTVSAAARYFKLEN